MRRPKGHPFPVPGIYTNFLNVPDHLAHSFEKHSTLNQEAQTLPRGSGECVRVSV